MLKKIFFFRVGTRNVLNAGHVRNDSIPPIAAKDPIRISTVKVIKFFFFFLYKTTIIIIIIIYLTACYGKRFGPKGYGYGQGGGALQSDDYMNG